MDPADPLLPKILVLVILILINAFFAAAEIAVISLSETKLRKQAEEGDKKAKKLLVLMQAPDSFLSAIQIAITLAGFLSSAFAADSFSDPLVHWLTVDKGFTAIPTSTLNTIMVVLITIVLSYFSLVLGELVPKRIAMKKTEAVARFTVGAVTSVATVFRPVIWLLSKSTNGVLRLLHIDPKADEEDVSEDEIRMMVDLGEERGAIESNEKELIDNIFEFNNTTAEDVMIHRTDMVMLWVEDTREEILATIRSSGLSRFPVYEENADDIIGILSTREYLLNAQAEAPKPMRELLRPAYFVPESVRTDVLFRDMQSKKVHMSIVVDEYGGTSGLVTMEDLLEEIVGNIYAIDVVMETGQASVSMLQRRLKLGYSRAARIVDEMEQRGIVGPFEGSKPRQLLITREKWEEIKMRGGLGAMSSAAMVAQGAAENPPVEEEIP